MATFARHAPPSITNGGRGSGRIVYFHGCSPPPALHPTSSWRPAGLPLDSFSCNGNVQRAWHLNKFWYSTRRGARGNGISHYCQFRVRVLCLNQKGRKIAGIKYWAGSTWRWDTLCSTLEVIKIEDRYYILLISVLLSIASSFNIFFNQFALKTLFQTGRNFFIIKVTSSKRVSKTFILY